MKTAILLLAIIFSLPALAQKQEGPVHGQTYGSNPDTTGTIDAGKLEAFMGNKARYSISIRGKIIRVSKEKGGWFTISEGNGRTIKAHFKEYNVTLPKSLAGRTVIVSGVAARQFVADDHQHLAGNTEKASTTSGISFEVKGLYVEK